MALVQDYFDGTSLGGHWSTEVFTVNGATPSFAVSGGKVVLTMPAAGDYDSWTGYDNSPRIMQAISSGSDDWVVTTRIDQTWSATEFRAAGILLETATGDVMRWECRNGGQLGAYQVKNGTGVAVITAFTSSDKWLRMEKVGGVLNFWHSKDGVNWTLRASNSVFLSGESAAQIGLHGIHTNAVVGVEDTVVSFPVFEVGRRPVEDAGQGGSATPGTAGTYTIPTLAPVGAMLVIACVSDSKADLWNVAEGIVLRGSAETATRRVQIWTYEVQAGDPGVKVFNHLDPGTRGLFKYHYFKSATGWDAVPVAQLDTHVIADGSTLTELTIPGDQPTTVDGSLVLEAYSYIYDSAGAYDNDAAATNADLGGGVYQYTGLSSSFGTGYQLLGVYGHDYEAGAVGTTTIPLQGTLTSGMAAVRIALQPYVAPSGPTVYDRTAATSLAMTATAVAGRILTRTAAAALAMSATAVAGKVTNRTATVGMAMTSAAAADRVTSRAASATMAMAATAVAGKVVSRAATIGMTTTATATRRPVRARTAAVGMAMVTQGNRSFVLARTAYVDMAFLVSATGLPSGYGVRRIAVVPESRSAGQLENSERGGTYWPSKRTGTIL